MLVKLLFFGIGFLAGFAFAFVLVWLIGKAEIEKSRYWE